MSGARHRRDGPLAGVVARLRAAGCVFAEDEAALLTASASSPAELVAMVDRRVEGLPLEHVLGWADFCGLRIAVGPGVFVPRRRSEFLVEQAAVRAPSCAVILDLCCGSGAVGAAVAARIEHPELYAADLDPAAVRYARRNCAIAAGKVFQGDLYDALPGQLQGRVDVLVANAPYVPTGELPLLPAEARLHEPVLSLDGGADGVEVQRRVAAGAARWLAPHGCLLIETSDRQAQLTAGLILRAGLLPQVLTSQDLEATVVAGTRRRPGPGR